MVNMDEVEAERVYKPIQKTCPNCGKKTRWYWAVDAVNGFNITYFKEKMLACSNCGYTIDPVELEVKPFNAWKEDKDNFVIIKRERKNIW